MKKFAFITLALAGLFLSPAALAKTDRGPGSLKEIKGSGAFSCPRYAQGAAKSLSDSSATDWSTLKTSRGRSGDIAR